MKSTLFTALLLACSALRAAATPSAIARTADIAPRDTHAVAAPADDRPWDLNIQTIVQGTPDSVTSLAITKISDTISLGEHVVTDETYLIEDNNVTPHELMANFVNRIASVFQGYGVVGTQEKTIVGTPHFNFIWLGAEFRSKNYPTIRADVVLSKNVNWHLDVKLNLPDSSPTPFVTSGSVNVVMQSDQGYERVTFTG